MNSFPFFFLGATWDARFNIREDINYIRSRMRKSDLGWSINWVVNGIKGGMEFRLNR